MALTDAVLIPADATDEELKRVVVALAGAGAGEGSNLFEDADQAQPRGSRMPTDEGYVHVDELPELLRSFGLVPPTQRADTVSVDAARELLGAFGGLQEGYERGWDAKKHPKWPKGHPDGGKFRPSGVLIMSRDGAVIDGHHRWAGAAAASVARGGTLEVDTMVLDLDWADALRAVKPFAKFEDLATDREGSGA